MFGRKPNDLNHRLDEIMQRLDAYEARLRALESGALKRRPERGDNGRFVSQKGAVRSPSGSE